MPFYTPAQKEIIIRRVRQKKRQRALTARGIEPPRSIEADYLKALRRIVRHLINRVNSNLLPAMARFEVELTQDSPSLIGYFSGIVDELDRQVGDIDKLALRISSKMANSTESFNRRKFVTSINEVIGVNLSDIIKADGVSTQVQVSIAENVDLIKTIPTEYHDKIKLAIDKGINKGDDFFSIRKRILELGQSTAKRAKLIARDQVAKLNAAVTQARQERIGVTHYFWRTSRDERVRPTHKANADKKFAWDDPPSKTGHPGHDIQCRCTPEPDLSHLLRIN
jgi:SPP1 gp7 family putative phage head morphogenesis protein